MQKKNSNYNWHYTKIQKKINLITNYKDFDYNIFIYLSDYSPMNMGVICSGKNPFNEV